MDTIEKKLKTNGADPRVLFGFGDSHLLYLEQRFDVTIVGRGDTIIVRGSKEDVDTIERILKEMKYIAQKTGTLSEKDVQTVVDLIASGKDLEMPPEEVDSIVLYTKGGYIKARTPGQHAFLKAARNHDIIFAIGPAGTGKTYMAVALALAALRNHDVGKIVLARPAVEAGERLGYLPGDLQEKVDPYLRPLYDALEDMLPADKLRAYLERRIIEIVPLAYMRGRTLNNAFIILDEAQNASSMQMKMCLTRLGVNSKAIITGDITQIDLPSDSVSGLVEIQNILKGVDGVAFLYFTKADVVRHKLVRNIIEAYERFHSNDDDER